MTAEDDGSDLTVRGQRTARAMLSAPPLLLCFAWSHWRELKTNNNERKRMRTLIKQSKARLFGALAVTVLVTVLAVTNARSACWKLHFTIPIGTIPSCASSCSKVFECMSTCVSLPQGPIGACSLPPTCVSALTEPGSGPGAEQCLTATSAGNQLTVIEYWDTTPCSPYPGHCGGYAGRLVIGPGAPVECISRYLAGPICYPDAG